MVAVAKNGPPLGHGATAVRSGITRVMRTLPAQLRRSLNCDQGSEMAEHVRLRTDDGSDLLLRSAKSMAARRTAGS